MTTAHGRTTVIALVVAAVLGSGAYGFYTHTREAYRAVGINDGRISQQEELLEKIRRSASIQDCTSYGLTVQRIEFLTVKAETLYLVKAEGANVQFCQ